MNIPIAHPAISVVVLVNKGDPELTIDELTIGDVATDLRELADKGLAGTWAMPGMRMVFARREIWHLCKWLWIYGWGDTDEARDAAGELVGDEVATRGVANHELHLFRLVDTDACERREGSALGTRSVTSEVYKGAVPVCAKQLWPTERAKWSVFQTGGDPRRLVHIVGHKITVCETCLLIDP